MGGHTSWLWPCQRLPAEPRSYETCLAVGFLAELLLSKKCLKWDFLLCYCPLEAAIQP